MDLGRVEPGADPNPQPGAAGPATPPARATPGGPVTMPGT